MTAFLVVDDDTGTRQVLHEVLEAKGYGVQQASDGPTGLRLLSHMRGPRFILLNPTAPAVELGAYTQALQKGDRLICLPTLITTTSPREAAGEVRLHKRPLFLEHLMDAIRAPRT